MVVNLFNLCIALKWQKYSIWFIITQQKLAWQRGSGHLLQAKSEGLFFLHDQQLFTKDVVLQLEIRTKQEGVSFTRLFLTICSLKVTSAVLSSCNRAEAFICSANAPRPPSSLVYPFRQKQTWMVEGGISAATDLANVNLYILKGKWQLRCERMGWFDECICLFSSVILIVKRFMFSFVTRTTSVPIIQV